jgi:hypothetical protein
MVISSTGLRTKNECAGEAQHKLPCPSKESVNGRTVVWTLIEPSKCNIRSRVPWD